MKLHLGCGKKKWDGFLNVDLHNSDMDCDIRNLPFGDDEVEEIHAIHVCEHFYITEIVGVLKEWRRVLKPGGVLVVELPCWDKVKMYIANNGTEQMTRWALYGEPSTHVDGEPALHKYCYSMDEFESLLELAGFKMVDIQQAKYHVPSRDMRLLAWK